MNNRQFRNIQERVRLHRQQKRAPLSRDELICELGLSHIPAGRLLAKVREMHSDSFRKAARGGYDHHHASLVSQLLALENKQ